MRITLDISDTVLAAARGLAQAEKVSLGEAVSRLALRGMRASDESQKGDKAFMVLAGAPDHVVTDELLDEFRDE